MPSQLLILEVNTKTLFVKFNDVYGECKFLIEDQPQLYPLRCLKDNCHRNANCMSKLAKRVHHLFEQFPDAQLIVLYFAYRDRPGSTRAGLFWRDHREPRLITLNRSGWEKMKEIGTIYEYTIPDQVLLA